MERETTGVELLLSEPEILAWLGLDDKHKDVPEDWQSGARPDAVTPTLQLL